MRARDQRGCTGSTVTRIDMAAPSALPEAFLNAWHESLAGLKCLSQTLALSDLAGDNDYRLLAADQEQKLRVYRGSSLSRGRAR